MKSKKVISVMLVAAMMTGMLAGCGSEKEESTASADGKTTLEYWTWYPSVDQAQEVIDAFEKENPDIQINMKVMESKTFREKVSLALSTDEDIDIIGVQPSVFATEVQDYLADLDELMESQFGAEWKDNYSEKAYNQAKDLTGGETKMLTIFTSGSMFGFYNVDLLNDIGCEVPKTLDEYKEVAAKLKEKYPEKYAGVFAGKESWVVDEMMLTLLGQQSDAYNKFVYDGGSADCPEYKQAIESLQQYFDAGIFSMDIMDLDYASATEAFTSGDALVYYMGSWEAPLLSPQLREQNGIDLNNVGVMALPVVGSGEPQVRGYLDCCIGVVDNSSKKEAAAKFVQYITLGEGANILGKQIIGPAAKTDVEVPTEMFGTEEEKAGWDTICEMIANASADRNNLTGYSDYEGAEVQSVINGTSTVDEAVKAMQSEWESGKY